MPAHTRMKILLLEGFLLLYMINSCFPLPSLEPGFLDFDNLPDTNFSCYGKVVGGYYADLETACQMFHVCTYGPMEEAMDIRFLCLNGTVFDQETRVCERIDEVDCSKSEKFYDLNLKLYGDTLPPILKEPAEKQKTTSSTTTKTISSSTSRPYYSSPKPTITATTHHQPKVITTHHFPVSPNSADIRFNPEEINISLKPGIQRPDIRPNPISYQQSSNYNSNGDKSKRVIVTTHTTVYKTSQKESASDKISSTARPNSVNNYSNNNPTPTEINYEFNYEDTESPEYQTESYKYQEQFQQRLNEQSYQSTTYRPPQIHPITHRISTTYRAPPIGSSTIKLVHPYQYQHSTEKPSRLQLPLPLLPTLPPLVFSSPAPFTNTRQEEAKRFNEHHLPRIVISASASVSDATGRKLNYTFGPLETSQIFDSYEDYKEDDEGVESFYHDVPKIKKTRNKRSIDKKSTDIIKSEEEAIGVLKFLFDWYSSNNKTSNLTIPLKPAQITEINDELMQANTEIVEINSSEDVSASNLSEDKNFTNTLSNDELSKNDTTNESNYDYNEDIPKEKNENDSKEYRKKSIRPSDINETDEESIKIQPKKDINTDDYVDDNYEIDLYKNQVKNNETLLDLNHGEVVKNETSNEVKEQNDGNVSSSVEESSFYDEYVDDNYEPDIHRQQVAKNKTSNMFDYDVEYVDDNYESELYQEQMLLKRLYDLASGEVRNDTDDSSGKDKQVDPNEQLKLNLSEAAEELKEDISKEPEIVTTENSISATIAPQINNSVEDYQETISDYETTTPHHETTIATTPNYAINIPNSEANVPQDVTESIDFVTTSNYEIVSSNYVTASNYDTTTPNYETTGAVETSLSYGTSTTSSSTEDVVEDATEPTKISDEYNKNELIEHQKETKKTEIKGSEERKTGGNRERNFRNRGRKRFELKEESTTSSSIGRRSRNRFTSKSTTTTTTTTTEEVPPVAESTESSNVAETDEELKSESLSSLDDYSLRSNEDDYQSNSEEYMQNDSNKDKDENISQTESEKEEDIKESVEENVIPTTAGVDLSELVKEIESTTKSVAYISVDIPTTAIDTTTASYHSPTEHATVAPTEALTESVTFETSLPESPNISHLAITTTSSETTLPTNAETSFTISTQDESSTIQTLSSQIPENYPSRSNDFHKLEHTTVDNSLEFVTTSGPFTTTNVPIPETNTPTTYEKLTTPYIVSTTAASSRLTTARSRIRQNQRTRNPTRRQRISSHRFSYNSSNNSRRNYNRIKQENVETTSIPTKFTIDSIQNKIKVKEKIDELEMKLNEEIPITEAPLSKSANPTLAKDNNNNNKKILTTTPLTKLVRIELRKERVNKNYIFNCFDKKINQFYSDPRDCRLFHYCTPGYTKNQLLDMKFVCDFGTYFDDEKLICTKTKPFRCT